MKEHELAYLAGIVDGEGSIGITHHKVRKSYSLRLQVANTSNNLMHFLSRFGGHIYEHKMHSSYHKQRYDWMVIGKKAQEIIRQIAPYIIIKIEQAKIALTIPIAESGQSCNKDLQEIAFYRMEAANA